MKIELDKLEEILGYPMKKNYSVIGVDTARRTGITFVKTGTKYAHLDWVFDEFEGDNKYLLYRQMYNSFNTLISEEDLAVIEEVFVGFSRKGSLTLAQMGAFVMASCFNKNIPFETISAMSARAKFGIKTSKKAGYGKGKTKLAVADWLRENLGLELEDDDISDSIVLGLLGICEGMSFEPKKKKRKKRKKRKKP